MPSIRGGHSGSLISAEAPEAFIEFKLSSEPCAWESYLKICAQLSEEPKEQERRSIFTLCFSFMILIHIHSPQLRT